MEAQYKARLKAIVLNLRHLLEGRLDAAGVWQPGDLEVRLAALGIRRDRESVPLDQLPHLSEEDRNARRVVDAFLESHRKTGVTPEEALPEFIRESAYTWANRLIALRCMEARGLIDEIILQKESYGGRSLRHHRLAQQNPELCAGEDDGLYATLADEFSRRAVELPLLFDPQAPAIALRPGVAALKACLRLLSAPDELFTAPDALGWAYQYWNTEEKDRVFDRVRTVKGAKIEKLDIIPVTQLYTEPYMVKFLVQNSLGALWMAMYPESRLCDAWEYFVRDADRPPVSPKPVQMFSFLDPCTGSGHFLLEAFDLLYAMYEEEGELKTPAEICEAILSQNLYGIDIDERSVQIAALALTMKAKEKASDFTPTRMNLTAANIHPANGPDRLTAFLEKHPEDKPLRSALAVVFDSLAHADELGALLQIEEPVEKELRYLKSLDDEEKTGQNQAVLPLEEFDKSEQQRLPLGVESYEDWKTGLLNRLKVHFHDETTSADLSTRFFGQAAGKGLTLFDFLSRRYDVVTTNPPYIGSQNMGPTVKHYVEIHFPLGKRDLYASFIIRCRELSKDNGMIGMVTQRGWLSQKKYNCLRGELLTDCQLNVIADLGPRAFEDVSGENVSVACFTFSNRIPEETFRVSLLSAQKGRDNEEKSLILRNIRRWHTTSGRSFSKLKFKQIICDLPDLLIESLQQDNTLRKQAEAEAGLWTGDDVRYVRCFWEINEIGASWRVLTKGGGYRKWCGLVQHVVYWGENGASIKATVCNKFPYLKGKWEWVVKNSKSYFLPGLTYSFSASACLGVRFQHEGRIFSELSPFIKVPDKHKHAICGTLNSRAYTALIRVLSDNMRLRADYVNELPSVPDSITSNFKFSHLVSYCLYLSAKKVRKNILEYECANIDSYTNSLAEDYADDALRLVIEDILDETVNNALNLSLEDVIWLYENLSPPAGRFALIHGYDSLPHWPKDLPEIPLEVNNILRNHQRQTLETDQLTSLRQRLFSLYMAGPGAKEETDDTDTETENNDDEENDQVTVGARIPIPAETFLEELSQKLEVHPISVYWLLKEGIEKDSWRCRPEEQRLTKDHFTVLILRLLGHRWPKQIEAGEAVPVWADGDGIIPLTEGTDEHTLHERLRDRLADECGNERVSSEENAFADVMGKPMKEWLRKDFFRHHCSQFKKRPIAWHVTSAQGNGNRRQESAFEAMVYYHRVDGDLLPKLRSQHFGPLQKRCEMELHGLENASARNLPAEQEARRDLLRGRIDELKALDETLSGIIGEGFGSASVKPLLRQFAINDAMHCLKVRWLRRLDDTVDAGPLEIWKTAADETELHPDLSTWITDAMSHLEHHCTTVGPRPPEQVSLSTDPTAADLVALIDAEADAMVPAALKCACDMWWKPFNQNVLKPLSEKIRDAKKEQKSLKDQSREASASVKDQLAIVERLDALKSEIKAWQKELDIKTGKGQAVREAIQSWRCPNALTWGDWLSEQAMYDGISSLDGKRPPPQTIQEFILQEGTYHPDVNDGVRVNIAPLQKAGILVADVLAAKDVEKAIADRASWRDDERRWCREGKLPKPGWWE